MAARGAHVCVQVESGHIHSLQDFVNVADLPTTVSVVGGGYSDSHVRLSRGDVLLLRSHLPKEVTLAFHSEDTGARKEITCSLDSSLKFVVLPPKNKGQLCDSHESLYTSVSDLLKDCPTYFQATEDYDDPYLPGFSVRQGDKFRFLRTFKDPRDDKVRLECKDNSGNVIRLSSDCKGYFRVLEDRSVYTLRELVNQARVSRRLRLSTDNVQLQPITIKKVNSTGSAEPNTEKEQPPSPLVQMPLTFKGVIHLRKPEEMLEVSPWGELETRWKIPTSVNLEVRPFSQNDYEVPVKQKVVSMKIDDFVSTYEDDFPVVATIVNYPEIHAELTNHLKNVSDVIVHKVKNAKRLLARTRTRYFSIDGNVRASFSEFPKSFRFIRDLLHCPPGTEVRVMGDIFSDFPKPFCLRYGDILRLVSNEPEKFKMKKSSFKECEVIRFQRIGDNGYSIPMLLPPDLEIKTMEITSVHSHRPHFLSDIIAGADIPSRTVTVLQEESESSLPLPSRFRLLTVVSDEVLVISPIDYSQSQAISPILESCIEIPKRHLVHFAFCRKLSFPDNYFVFPRSRHTVSIRVEKITEEMADEMRNKSDPYEDVAYNPTQTPMRLPRSLSAGAIDKVKKRKKNPLQRLSRALNPINWRRSHAPATLARLSQEPSPPTNDYDAPPRSPGARSNAEDDPYEQINIQIGASLASANQTYSHTDIASAIIAHRGGIPRTTAI
ncbi:uncharacterized protein [Haliotis asinina]|uniref:uncharacterized protein isoform X1 n=1 Tax=Haliotis asinina TaxID=109174 RepID=UPI0035325440